MMGFVQYAKFFLGAVALLAMYAAPAQAQATRTWVSGVGDDANPCSRTAPCKTFAGAISKTAAKGEINVLDPGGFGAVTITKSISIISDHIQAGVLAAGTNGIVINAASTDYVLLEGLNINGWGTGINGVHIIGGGSVVIRRTSIRGFIGNGVNMVGLANTRLLIQDSNVSFNGGGILVEGNGGVINTAIIDRTTVDTHTNFGVKVSAGGTASISDSQFIGGTSPRLTMTGGGTIASYGNNIIRGNTELPTTTFPLR